MLVRSICSAFVNVFGKVPWFPEVDCENSQIDIFQNPLTRIKKLPGASNPAAWWLRSAIIDYYFSSVSMDGNNNISADNKRGVVIGFCIETRNLTTIISTHNTKIPPPLQAAG